MDLLVIEECPERHRAATQRHSITTHRTIRGDDRVVMVRSDGTPIGLMRALKHIVESEKLSDTVCITRDNTFVIGEWDPCRAWALELSARKERKGALSDAMVATLSELFRQLEDGVVMKGTYDFEGKVPKAFSLPMLKKALDIGAPKGMLLDTLYFNMIGEVPVRVADPVERFWMYNYNPKGPIVTLEDTCYSNNDCHIWIRKQVPAPAVA